MAIDFPASPTTGQSYTDTTTGQTWIYNGVGWASSYNRSSVVRQSFTASAGQTTFTVSGGYSPGLLDVYQNGVKLVSGSDYTASNGTTVILTAAAAAGDSVEVWGIANFAVANAPTLSQFYGQVGDAGPVVNRNRVINGDMRIDQRNSGSSVTVNNGSANAMSVDRWQGAGETTDGVFTLQQSTSSPPVGFTHFLRATVTTADASIGASQRYSILTKLEGFTVSDFNFGSANARSVTLSFWVRSSVTGTFGGTLRNAAGTRTYPFTWTINNANTWEFETIVIPGDVTGTWATDNSTGFWINFDLGSGSSLRAASGSWAAGDFRGATGAVSLISTLNATYDITGVQLEIGGTVTPFERRSYIQELAMCQRYFEWCSFNVYGYQSTTGEVIGGGVNFRAPKRTAPTLGSITTDPGATPTSSNVGSSGTNVPGLYGCAVFVVGSTSAPAQVNQRGYMFSASAEL